MNWTGGTLQRTKHANKGVIQKQRAYFARARTKPHQSPGTHATPFRPDYLQEGDGRKLGRHLPSFGSCSARHTGHSARKRRGEERHTSPTARRQQRADDQKTPQRTSSDLTQGRHRSEIEREEQREKMRKDTDGDIETQLLEANKKRLLRQQDWIGVALSKPVDLQLLSIKEKTRIGKRRKLDWKRKAVTRCRSPITLPHRTGQDELDGRDDTFMSGALPPVLAAADNIRVRIGSDALMTAASTQPLSYARSQTNSDSMLFDEEVDNAVRRKESDAPHGVPSGHGSPRSTVFRPAKSDRIYLTQHGLSAHHSITERLGIHADKHTRHAAADLGQSFQQSEATDLSHRLTHHVGGIERPLKLFCCRRNPSHVSPTASPTDKTGETQRGNARFDAEETKIGHAPRNVCQPHRFVDRKHSKSPAIDDDGPWRTNLGTDTSSSGRVRIDDGTGTSVPQPHVPAQNTGADHTSWPLHIIQGNLTHANLSIVSASLPAFERTGVRVPNAHPLPRAVAVREVNKDEEVWLSLALGSDSQSAIETIHTHEPSEDSTSRAIKGYASTRLPLSNAVTSVSSTPFPSTPFRSLSGQASRISDDVQYEPPSAFRSITSAVPIYAVWGRAELPNGEEVLGEEQGDKTSAGSQFGEQSTHASLQEHASLEMLSEIRTSRSDLDRRSRRWDDVSRRAQASGSTVWQRGRDSSIGDISDSDEAGIDLVDVDRLM